MPTSSDQIPQGPKGVRETLAANIKRIRKRREMTGREFVDRLQERGVKLLPSGLTAMEKGQRRLTVEELLAVAIVLNTSVIDLLTPADGSALEVADGVQPMEPLWLELWLQGENPWPQEAWGETFSTQLEAFLASASEHRRNKHRRDSRPELQAIDGLKERVRRAIELHEGDPRADTDVPPKGMVSLMRNELDDVRTYIDLLANQIELRS